MLTSKPTSARVSKLSGDPQTGKQTSCWSKILKGTKSIDCGNNLKMI